MLEKLSQFTIPLGKWFEVPVYIHWSWWMFGLFMLFFNPVFVPVFLASFGIILLHEFGHIFAAQYFKWRVYDVVLYPIGGAARMNLSSKPWEEFIVAISGPAVNMALIAPLHSLSDYSGFGLLSAINIVILTFNLLPIFPMDGGRIFRSILQSVIKNRSTSTHIAVRVSQCLCCVLGVFALCFGQFMLVAIMGIMAVAAQAELSVVRCESNQSIGGEVKQSADMIGDIQLKIDRYRRDFDR